MLKPVGVAIGAIAVVVALVIAANIWPRGSNVEVVPADPTPLRSTSPSAALLPIPSAAPLPVASPIVNGWPGPRGGPAGRYSWSGANGSWMHNPTDESIGVSMTFSAVAIDEASEPTSGPEIRYDWTYQALPISADGVRTELWNADFDRRRVTITVEAQPDTTAEQLVDAKIIIKSIRSEPTDTGAFRLTFILPDGWDSG